MKTKPFFALRPPASVASSLAAVPYDVVDSSEARALADGNANSFLHVSRPEIDLPDGTDPHSDLVYAKAAENLKAFIDRGSLFRDPEPSYYVYRQVMGDHAQTGLVACCHIDDYAADIIRKHEKTRQDKEDDRTRHVLALNANTGPVFLTYRDDAKIDEIVEKNISGESLYDFVAPDGVRHTVWKVTIASAELEKALVSIPVAYVADGHHRAKAAYRAGCERRTLDASPTGEEEYNWFLAVLFPASQLRILPYNRCVADLNGYTPDEFLEKVTAVFNLAETSEKRPSRPRHVSIYLQGRWYSLSWEAFDADPVSSLDVSVLQERLLGPILAIDDPRTNGRISFVGGIRGTRELERLVDSNRAAVAFSMSPTTVEEMMAIADAGQIMPPKSTWFEPKLRSGLLVHEIV